jgi:phage-related holin
MPQNFIAFSFGAFWTNILSWFVVYFTPVSEMIHVMLFFLAVDTISGIWASVKEGNRIQSSKLRRTVMKFLWYTAAVMISWMMERTFLPSWTKMTTVIAGFITFVEFKSILENVSRITEEPIFARILTLLRKKSADTISEIVDDPDDKKKQPKS